MSICIIYPSIDIKIALLIVISTTRLVRMSLLKLYKTYSVSVLDISASHKVEKFLTFKLSFKVVG
jgi:hypothetical protein